MSMKWEEYGLDPKKLWPNPYEKKDIKDKNTIKLVVPKKR